MSDLLVREIRNRIKRAEKLRDAYLNKSNHKQAAPLVAYVSAMKDASAAVSTAGDAWGRYLKSFTPRPRTKGEP